MLAQPRLATQCGCNSHLTAGPSLTAMRCGSQRASCRLAIPEAGQRSKHTYEDALQPESLWDFWIDNLVTAAAYTSHSARLFTVAAICVQGCRGQVLTMSAQR